MENNNNNNNNNKNDLVEKIRSTVYRNSCPYRACIVRKLRNQIYRFLYTRIMQNCAIDDRFVPWFLYLGEGLY